MSFTVSLWHNKGGHTQKGTIRATMQGNLNLCHEEERHSISSQSPKVMSRPRDGSTWCQANTEPVTQFEVELTVTDTVAVIEGPKELFVKAGDQLRLHCTVQLGARQAEHRTDIPCFTSEHCRD